MTINLSLLAPIGLVATIEAAGIHIYIDGTGAHCPTPALETAALNIINTYAGSASELAFHKALKQTALDAEFDTNFDLTKFIRGGSATNITGTNVGTFLATITNNYRSLRASIASAATVAAVDAINIAAGWPANP